ncbi:hypothetical protein D7Y27_23740 [Corallococcus sp. AB004]|nr:hypothetical protein D7Y27_23740 [Corallococcus sp. AB004]
MSSSDDENIKRLRRGLDQRSQWRTKNEEIAANSLTDFLLDLIRPLVKGVAQAAVSAFSGFIDWLQGLFTKK